MLECLNITQNTFRNETGEQIMLHAQLKEESVHTDVSRHVRMCGVDG